MLTASEAEAYCNRFGKKQDAQRFYEDPVLDDLIAHADFQNAQGVFEFGCGYGVNFLSVTVQFIPYTTKIWSILLPEVLTAYGAIL